MDPLFGRTSSQLGKPSSPTSHPKDFISIRALSYQKFVPETKLQEDCNI